MTEHLYLKQVWTSFYGYIIYDVIHPYYRLSTDLYPIYILDQWSRY